ncbi:hypothetical protein BC829DRAFT_356295, partial [Chytridium lagenaria]
RLHSFVVYVNASPQRRQLLSERISLKQPTLFEINVRGLIEDVKTRWNSTHDMLKRLVELRPTITDLCLHPDYLSFKNFSLTEEEWNKVEQLTKLLEP